jgi:hypothetical protein
MADYYSPGPKFQTIDVPVRAIYVAALEREAAELDPEHNHGESAVSVLDDILAHAFTCADCGEHLSESDIAEVLGEASDG